MYGNPNNIEHYTSSLERYNIYVLLQSSHKRYVMPDNLNIRQPQDPNKININETWEVSYWTRTLGVTEQRLREAVKAVGPMVSAVRTWLAINR